MNNRAQNTLPIAIYNCSEIMATCAAACFNPNRMKNILLSAVLSIISYFTFCAVYPAYVQTTLQIVVKGPPGRYLIFYKSDDEYTQADSKLINLSSQEFETLELSLPGVGISQIRIDPGQTPGEVLIKSICLRRADKENLCWNKEQLFKAFRARRGISDFKMQAEDLKIGIADGWPFFETVPELSSKILSYSKKPSYLPGFFSLGIGLLTFLALARLNQKKIDANHSPCKNARQAIASMLIILPCIIFFKMCSAITSITPPFQGADEGDHLALLLSDELNIQCPQAPHSFIELQNRFEHLSKHRERYLSLAELDSFISLKDSEMHGDIAPLGNNACEYNRAYVRAPKLINSLKGISAADSSALRYLDSSRRSVALLSSVIWFLTLSVALFGSFLLGFSSSGSLALRSSAYFATIYYMFIPQNIWLSSVLSQDYLLNAFSQFAVVSLFFRVPLLSEIGLLLGLVAASSKVVYLLPAIACLTLHYLFYFKRRNILSINPLLLRSFVVISSLLGLFVVIAPSIAVPVLNFCRANNCFGLAHASVFKNISSALSDIKSMIFDFGVSTLPNFFERDSAFGFFGWLDTPLPTYYKKSYSAPLMLTFYIGLLFAPWAIYRDCTIRKESLTLFLSYCLISLCSFTALYLVFSIMQQWCGAAATFGCGYQHRYALPYYGIVPLTLLSLSFIFIEAPLKKESELKFGSALFFLVTLGLLQIITIRTSFQGTIEALSQRYFLNQEAQQAYNELISLHP